MNATVEARASFDRLLGELRPKLHRYCARMTGSVFDGEDVVQEALMKAIEAFPKGGSIGNPEGWLFRIAPNSALDFLRRRARHEAVASGEDPDTIADTKADNAFDVAAVSLRTFLRLAAAQRSSVILMDVLGYSLEEIGGILESSVPAVRAVLHRGRARLRELSKEPDNLPLPVLTKSERLRLAAYERFNARDFDAVRDMLADDVRLELIARTQLNGRRVAATYFHNYESRDDWRLVLGFVDRRPALLVRDPRDPAAPPIHFVTLDWAGNRISTIRDFRHARYAIEGAEIFIPV